MEEVHIVHADMEAGHMVAVDDMTIVVGNAEPEDPAHQNT